MFCTTSSTIIKEKNLNIYYDATVIMSAFIKLTSIIINTKQLNKIVIKPDKYFLHMNNRIDGYSVPFMGSTISSGDEILEICAIKEPSDYQLIKTWIYTLK